MGSAIVATMEGTKRCLFEVQSLVTPTHFRNTRRMATGTDANRLSLLMASARKNQEGMLMQQHDLMLKIAGGVKLDGAAVDLSVIISIASSFKNIAVRWKDSLIGEVGMTRVEIRRVTKVANSVCRSGSSVESAWFLLT